MTIEFTSKLLDAMLLEVEVVHVHIKALLVTGAVVLFGILKQEGCLAHATSALDAYETVVPVNLVHKAATDRGVRVLHKVGVSAEKGFHADLFLTSFNAVMLLVGFLEQQVLISQLLSFGKGSIFLSDCKV